MKVFKIIINQSELMKLYPNGKPNWIKDKHELLQHSINTDKLDISDDCLVEALSHLKTSKAITEEQYGMYLGRISTGNKSIVIKSQHVKDLIQLREKRKRMKMIVY